MNNRILVIDDDKSIHIFMKQALKAEFEVSCVFSGEEGLERIENDSPYALVFIDVRLPGGLGGVETAKRISCVDPNIRITLMTAADDFDIDDMETDGIIAKSKLLFINKPFKKTEVLVNARCMVERWNLGEKYKQNHDRLFKVMMQYIDGR